jgi:hypothetical protein
MEAVDIVRAVDALQALVRVGPSESASRLKEAQGVLSQLSRGQALDAYQTQRLATLQRDLSTWFGPTTWTGSAEDVSVFSHRLMADIEHLKKALARHSHVQD